MTEQRFTLQELLIARMARELRGEKVTTGASVLSDIAARVAKHLYDPDIVLIGGSYAHFDCAVHAKGFNEEWAAEMSAHVWLSWSEVFDIIRRGRFQIWINPAQIDKRGNANISVIGDWQCPRVQLVGARGMPDDLWGIEKFFYHVRRHSKQTFVEKVDFVCSLGFEPEREALRLNTGLPGWVISDFGVFGWSDDGEMTIESLHPGVTLDVLRENTGFDWGPVDATEIPQTEPPTDEELECIRTVADPLGWRQLDALSHPLEALVELMSEEVERLEPTLIGLADRPKLVEGVS